MSVLKAERIGHGYRVLEDESIYQRCLEQNIHFECCPNSSLLTGAVSLDGGKSHPILRFAKDQASFSVNTDDPTITNTKLSDEYKLLLSWGLTVQQLQMTVMLKSILSFCGLGHAYMNPAFFPFIYRTLML